MLKTNQNQKSVTMRRKVRTSTVKNRRSFQAQKEAAKPEKIEIKIVSAKAPAPNPVPAPEKTEGPVRMPNPEVEMKSADLTRVNERMRARMEPVRPVVSKISAKELKEQAIEKAMRAAEKTVTKETKKQPKIQIGFGRILLAMSCAAAIVFAIVYFVDLNSPNISLQVAAMQTGIDAKYPSYIPRDFSLSDVTSENEKVVMNFKNRSSGDTFSLTEEKSSWDSNALLENYVRKEYDEKYVAVKENGLTIYISGGDAAWVNGGVVFKLEAVSGTLTKKQIRSIAVSL
ncbi:MAG: DUF4367 domain-containing protein [Candidatus Saccharibacteria bacterium]|nr:DUF4367 domain-containing protein [Candidatus Saccharibacteria bacterium]